MRFPHMRLHHRRANDGGNGNNDNSKGQLEIQQYRADILSFTKLTLGCSTIYYCQRRLQNCPLKLSQENLLALLPF